METNLIGLNGLKGSGKDTVGTYMAEAYGFTRISFASKLKESAAALFDFDPVQWDDMKNDPNAIVSVRIQGANTNIRVAQLTVREFLQRYGTEAHRDIFGDDFWVDQALDDWVQAGLALGRRFVVTDARFPNELKRIRELGGINVQIVRPAVESGDEHRSEILPPANLINRTILNTGTIHDLYASVDSQMGYFSLVE